jgi:hypothetical protein
MFAGDPKVLATILEDQLDCSILGAHLLLDVHLCGEKQQTKMTYRGWHYRVEEEETPRQKEKNKRLKVSLLCMSIAGEVQRMVPSCKGRNKILKEFL